MRKNKKNNDKPLPEYTKPDRKYNSRNGYRMHVPDKAICINLNGSYTAIDYVYGLRSTGRSRAEANRLNEEKRNNIN